jgi:hypothetical protein
MLKLHTSQRSQTLQRRLGKRSASAMGLQTKGIAAGATKAPADRSEGFVLAVTDDVRIISDHLQWIVQIRKGKPDAKSFGWRARHFCRSREGLQLALRRMLGRDVPARVVAQIDAFPEWHHLWLGEVKKD